VATPGGTVTIQDLATGGQRRSIGPGPTGTDVQRIALTADGSMIATSTGAAPSRVWDANTGEELFSVSDADTAGRWIYDLEWSRDGGLLAVAESGHDGAVASSAWSAGRVVVVDQSGRQLSVLPEEPGYVMTAASFSPDGELLVTARRSFRDDFTDSAVKIWDWRQAQLVRTLASSASNVVWDPTGARIATSAHIKGIGEVWDAETGAKVATLEGTSIISDAAFSPNGSHVASAGLDGTVRVWDTETGVQQTVMRGGTTLFHAVAYSPDGSRVASVDDNGLVRVWALDLDDLIAIANERLTRSFSADECRQYLHVERCPDA